jgi:hypothetical protein
MVESSVDVLFDFYDWLPGDGEDKLSYRSDGANLTIAIEYRDESDSDRKVVRELSFKSASYVFKGNFPGVSPMTQPGVTAERLGKVLEFRESSFVEQATRAYLTVSPNHNPRYRHFFVSFLSQNVVFNVLARDVHLSDAIPQN